MPPSRSSDGEVVDGSAAVGESNSTSTRRGSRIRKASSKLLEDAESAVAAAPSSAVLPTQRKAAGKQQLEAQGQGSASTSNSTSTLIKGKGKSKSNNNSKDGGKFKENGKGRGKGKVVKDQQLQEEGKDQDGEESSQTFCICHGEDNGPMVYCEGGCSNW